MLAMLYLAGFIAAGIDAGNRLFSDRPPLIRIWLGAIMGLAAQIWLPALWAFAFDFGPVAHALAAATGVWLWLWVFLTRRRVAMKAWSPDDGMSLKALLAWGGPLLALMIILFMNHVLMPGSMGLYGGQSTYGDLSMHLGMVSSIAVQGFWPPEYSILPGTRLCYPFLVDSHSASLMLLGLPIRWAVIVPSVLMTGLCFMGFHLLAYDYLRCHRRTVLSCLLFFVTGGLGFLFFMNGALAEGSDFRSIFTAFYHTPTNDLDQDLRWVNVLCDMMIPQRTTLLGWTMAPACLYLAYHGGVEGSRRDIVAGGILAGSLPMMHTHSFLALGMVCGGWLVGYVWSRKNKGAYLVNWLLYLAIVGVLAAPQLIFWTFRQSTADGFLRLVPGWVIGYDPYFWFWIKNVGLPFIFILPAVWARWKKHLPWYGGAILIFVVAQLVLFQPNAYDNNKLLYVWYLFTAVLVADYLVMLWDRMKGVPGRVFLAAVCAVALFASGALTVGREMNSGGEYLLYDNDTIAAADYLTERAPEDAMVITADQHTNAIAALTGRNIYVGSGTFLYFHGLSYEDRQKQVAEIFADPAAAGGLLTRIGADYILVSRYECSKYSVSGDVFDCWYPVAFRQGQVTLYAVSDRAQAAMAP